MRRPLTGNLFAAGSMIAWSVGFPAVEALMRDWDLLPAATGRFVMALLVLFPVWLAVEGPASVARARWGRGLVIGAVGFGGGAWGTLVSQAYTDPVTAAIFASATPICASIVDWVWLRRVLQLRFLLGLAAAVAGGIVATGSGVPGSFGLGALSAILAGLFFAWGSLMLVRELPGHSTLARTTVTTAGALLAFLLAMAVLVPLGVTSLPADPWTWRSLGLFILYGAVSFSLSQFLWVAGTERLGLSLASFHINVAPFYTMLILLALGGTWSWPQAIGAAIVGLGVIVAQGRG